jgi:cobalamin biosynthesis Mg chelatase CobN
MSTAVKRPHLKPVRVAPTVTDPSMRNSRGPAEILLNSETGGEHFDDHDSVFGAAQKTKEEQEVVQTDSSSQASTMLIIVFALIVIALVALIVWMLIKQSNDKKDEEEMRRMIQPHPHPRNNMPPNYGVQGFRNAHKQHMTPNTYMTPVENKAHQHKMEKINTNLEESDKKESRSFAEVMAEKDKKEVIQPLKDPLLEENKYSKKNPHPNILRPGASAIKSDVDDILQKTEDMLKEPLNSSKEIKNVNVSNSKKESLTDLDKALLDKVHNNVDDIDE